MSDQKQTLYDPDTNPEWWKSSVLLRRPSRGSRGSRVQLALVKIPNGQVFNSGPHKGLKLSQVPVNYLESILDQFTGPPKRVILKHLKHRKKH